MWLPSSAPITISAKTSAATRTIMFNGRILTMTYDLDSNAVLYVWLTNGRQPNPLQGSLGRLRQQALTMPKDGIYKIEIECDGTFLDYAAITACEPRQT